MLNHTQKMYLEGVKKRGKNIKVRFLYIYINIIRTLTQNYKIIAIHKNPPLPLLGYGFFRRPPSLLAFYHHYLRRKQK